MSGFESIFYWAAAVLLAATFFAVLLALVFSKSTAYGPARSMLYAAFASITAFGVLRWVQWGHPPFVTLFESMITSIWFLLLMYILMGWLAPRMRILLLPVSLVGFLMMGWSWSLPHEATPLSEALTNTWLFIHASFATLGASVFLIAASLSGVFLMGRERAEKLGKMADRIPHYDSLPKSILNFLIFGMILWGVMIVSGSIWAHVAWGRYWAWDPIELWSLISWLLYGLVLHARLAFKLPRRVFCWLTIAAALTVVFALWGVGYIYETIHSYG